ncbi:efflux RND transporter permease subunit [Venenivibrio stagnispumantis]|uniref:Heavy metal efflux pump, CzcA family/hydrophobe/amphiphile efflux-1 (HAE1) family protein n=1 Tax=Venenivibrio stagnispumantis TaxID=407998 RepID=A0AA46ADF9_9AQUI|nr:efflux RND transporter permease subunit [Venenivibrio stagnispumantis]MCW4572920.1 efflux RND transporter permease subunit [Venenivibrio stagnispumantis]SMP04559.1 heavy metal efflux pump, CzcA family/hydrophobe/amphiphile efflux-1 (HAE1) family protein [Venenivibrio stagnispumantis]
MYSFFIRRPITTWMFILAFIVTGIYALKNIPIDRNPDVDFPIVSISTTYQGASPYVVDTNITRKIEDELATISGIESIVSQSYTGQSRITVIFDLDKDIDIGAQEVRDAVNRIIKKLPEGTDPPVVRKVDTSLAPIMAILLHGNVDYSELSYYADKIVKREIERVQGVGEVDLGGFRDRVMWVRLNPEKLAGHNLAPLDVVNAIQSNHLETPAGRIDSKNREYILRIYSKAKSADEINNIIIKNNVRIKDIGNAEFSFDEERSAVRFKAFDAKEAEPAVAIIVYKQSKSNTVEVSNKVKQKMEELNKQLPPGMRLDINYDSSTFIERSVHDALEEIVIGGLLTALTVFLFLGSFRMTFIPAMAIPVSILGAITFLYLFGYSLNTITLLAMAVAVGLVIDDAIVVMESIYRRNEEGLKGIEAAEKGTKTVIFALLASTASLIVIFVPVLFIKSVIGKFFIGFAFTLIVAIAISYIVSLSFTPMASARIIKVGEKNIFQKLYDKFENGFDKALKWSLNHKLIVLAVAFITVIAGFKLAGKTGKEFFPIVDEGRFLIRFETPTGSSFEFTNKKAKEMEKIISSNPYILRYGVALGEGIAGRPEVNGGIFFITLKDRKTRPHQKVIMDMLRKDLRKVPDVRAIIDIPSAVGPRAGRSADIMYIIKGSDINELAKVSSHIESELRSNPSFVDVDTDIRINKPEIRITIDKDKALMLGVSTKDIADTINIIFGKYQVGTFEEGSESYDFYVKANTDFLKEYNNLDRIYVRAANSNLVPLSNLIKFEPAPGFNVINRYNRQYSVTIYANMASGKPVSEGIIQVENIIKKYLPAGYTYEIGGQTKEFKRTFAYLGAALIVAIVAVYMILAALFESLIHPFTVLLMLPFAIVGTFALILITGTTLNVTSYFGIILLIGLVTRDSVLFIERIIQLKKDGKQTLDAILQARKERLRPILMTTLTIIASLIPVALGITEGSEMRQPLAIAVIGGLLSALPLSLFVIPIVYMLFDKVELFLKSALRR